MKIEKNSVVELDYKLMDLEGNVWESSKEGGPWDGNHIMEAV